MTKQITNMDMLFDNVILKVCLYISDSYTKVKNGFFIFPKTKVYSIRIWKSSLKMKWLRNFPPFFVTQVFDLLGFTLTGIYKIEKKEHNKKL